jgi:hypothetical protein
MENDYGDGTSSLWGDYTGNGLDYAIDFAPDGSVIGFVQNSAATQPPTQDINDPDDYLDAWYLYSNGCTQNVNGTIYCGGSELLHSRWFCGIMVGSGALGAKYGALQMKAGQPWADIAGMIVGVTLGQLCIK